VKHSLAWLILTICIAASALMIRNPLYLAIIALSMWLIYTVVREDSQIASSLQGLLKLGLWVWAITIPFNALMIHQGNIILFSLPRDWPLIGGNITVEAVAFGFASGFALWTLLLIFATFNVAVDASQLLRLVPPFLYQAGIVTSIALTFIPQMLASAREIREAQRIRGHRFRTWRDSLPLVIPLLTTAFERAIQLAESLESRGFGGELTGLDATKMVRIREHMLLALAFALAGLIVRALAMQWAWAGTLLLLAGAILLIQAMRNIGQHVERSHYERARWDRHDTLVAGAGIFVLLATMIIRFQDKLALSYYPYPPNDLLPEFNITIGLIYAILALPGLAILFGNTRRNALNETPSGRSAL